MDRDVKTVHALPYHKPAVELADGRRGVYELRPFVLDRRGLRRLKDPHYFASVGVRFTRCYSCSRQRQRT